MAATDMNAVVHVKDVNGNVNNIYPATKIANVEGLQSALNAKADSTTVTNQLSGKVDKVTGKGLSTNDYTTAEKNKLAGIADGATANIGTVTKVKVGTTSYSPSSGVVSLPAYPTSLPADGGTASNVSGTVAIANGGTGAKTAAAARTNLGLGTAAVKNATDAVTNQSGDLVTSGAVYSTVNNVVTQNIENKSSLYAHRNGRIIVVTGYIDNIQFTANTGVTIGTINDSVGRPGSTIRAMCMVAPYAYEIGTPSYLSIGTDGKINVLSTYNGTGAVYFTISYMI